MLLKRLLFYNTSETSKSEHVKSSKKCQKCSIVDKCIIRSYIIFRRDVKFYTNERPRTFSLSQECYNPEYLDAEEELKLRVAELMKKPLQPCAPNK